jgi:hypothetical protein
VIPILGSCLCEAKKYADDKFCFVETRTTVEEAIRNADIQSKIREIFDEVFDNDLTTSAFTFKESNNLTKPATTQLTDVYPLHVTTILNTSILSNASLEYTTLVIFHEIVHGILYFEGKAEDLHHPEILEKYVNEIARAGRSLFPNLPLIDAQALALLGLADSSDTDAYKALMAKLGLTNEAITETGLAYRRDNVEGNVKKGTPCSN